MRVFDQWAMKGKLASVWGVLKSTDDYTSKEL